MLPSASNRSFLAWMKASGWPRVGTLGWNAGLGGGDAEANPATVAPVQARLPERLVACHAVVEEMHQHDTLHDAADAVGVQALAANLSVPSEWPQQRFAWLNAGMTHPALDGAQRQWAGIGRYEHALNRAGRRLGAQQEDFHMPWCYDKPTASAAGLHPIERRGFGAAQGGAVQNREQRAIAQAGWRGWQRRKNFAQERRAKGLGLPCGAPMHASDAGETRPRSGCDRSKGRPDTLCAKAMAAKPTLMVASAALSPARWAR